MAQRVKLGASDVSSGVTSGLCDRAPCGQVLGAGAGACLGFSLPSPSTQEQKQKNPKTTTKMYMNVRGSIIHYSQNVETAPKSISRWGGKHGVWPYKGSLFSHKRDHKREGKTRTHRPPRMTPCAWGTSEPAERAAAGGCRGPCSAAGQRGHFATDQGLTPQPTRQSRGQRRGAWVPRGRTPSESPPPGTAAPRPEALLPASGSLCC